MDYTSRYENNVLHFELSGQLTFSDNQKFKEIIESLNQVGIRALEMDFSGITFIDSAGLGMLLLLRDNCNERHIPITIISPVGQVQKVFQISKFDQLFKIVA